MKQVAHSVRQSKAVIAGGMFALVLSTLMAAPAHAAPSTFQKSCRNIELYTDSGEVTIQAQCRTRSGAYITSSVELLGISNQNGVLRARGEASSSFQNSCRNIRLRHPGNQ